MIRKVRERYSSVCCNSNVYGHSAEMAQPGLALSTTELIQRYSTNPDKLSELRKYDSYSGSVRIRPASDLTDYEQSLKKVNNLKDAIDAESRQIEDAKKEAEQSADGSAQTVS